MVLFARRRKQAHRLWFESVSLKMNLRLVHRRVLHYYYYYYYHHYHCSKDAKTPLQYRHYYYYYYYIIIIIIIIIIINNLGGSPSPAQDFVLRRFGRSTPTFLKQNSVHKTKQSVYVHQLSG